MTTAELIKKREEEKNLQATQPSFSSMVVKPDPTNVTIPVDNSVNREYARNTAQEKSVNRQIEAGNTPETSDAALDALKKVPEQISLYEVGKANAATGIANAENSVKNPSPINTKEMEDFRNQIIGVRDFGVETPEQAERRERNAFIKQGLTGLTEGLSSLANLYYTTKWAPNQKMTSQMPALQQRLYRERLERDKKLENFRAWMRAKAEKDADRAYQEKVTADNRAYQDGVRKAQWEREDKIREQNQANLDREFEYKVNKDTEETAYRRKKDEEDTKRWWANFGLQKERINERNSPSRSSGSGKSSKMAVINTPKGVMDVDFGRINETTYNQMYNNVSKEIKDMFPINSYDDEKTVQQKRGEAISYALQKQEGYSDWLEKAGVGTYQLTPLQPQDTNTNNSGGKWDAYDVTNGNGGSTDFSKQKRTSATSGKRYQSPTPPEQQTTMANITSESSGNQKKKNGNVYEQMADEALEKREYDKRVDEAKKAKAKADRDEEVKQAKEKRAQLNSQLINEYADFDIDKLIEKRGLSPLEARGIRMKYHDNMRKRKQIQGEIDRLNAVIGQN